MMHQRVAWVDQYMGGDWTRDQASARINGKPYRLEGFYRAEDRHEKVKLRRQRGPEKREPSR